MMVRCSECDRWFDLTLIEDAAEFFSGHDCEPDDTDAS